MDVDRTAAQAGFESFEHTADVGLRVWAPCMRELFMQAARGFIDMLFAPGDINAARELRVKADGAEPEELLVSWLEEILFAFDARGFAPAGVEINEFGDGCVVGVLRGETFDPERHEVRQPVKAVTYHDLDIRQTESGYEARIVFDV